MPEENTQAPVTTEHLIDTQPEAPVETVPSAEAQEAEQPERPEWLPEKFKSPEDLAKSYTELEKKVSTNKVPDAYDFSMTKDLGLDEMPEDLSQEVTDVFKKSGFTQDQVKTAMALYSDQMGKITQQMANSPRVDLDQEQSALQQQWGNEYADRLESVKKYAGTLPQRVLEQPLVDTAEGIQFLEQLMSNNRMPNPITNTQASATRDANSVREDIRTMRQDDKFKLPPGDPVGETHRQKLYNLYEQLSRLEK